MTIKNIFFKQLDRPINGVVKADQADDATVYQELDEYVVTNELEKHFRSFFESYSTDLNDPSIANRVGVWISGFPPPHVGCPLRDSNPQANGDGF